MTYQRKQHRRYQAHQLFSDAPLPAWTWDFVAAQCHAIGCSVDEYIRQRLGMWMVELPGHIVVVMTDVEFNEVFEPAPEEAA